MHDPGDRPEETMDDKRPPTRLYLISPPAIELDSFASQLKDAFSGGTARSGKGNVVGSFQLRLKNAGDAEICEAARTLMPICHAHNAAFILNDRPDLAVACNADGVHIGQDDGGVKKARETVGPNRVIGVSCHDSRHLAMDAGELGADYVAFGAFHPTRSKSPEALAKWGTPTPDILEWWQAFTVVPCVAIGGITPANCAALAEAGADFVAVITAVWQHPMGPKAAVAEFNEVLDAV